MIKSMIKRVATIALAGAMIIGLTAPIEAKAADDWVVITEDDSIVTTESAVAVDDEYEHNPTAIVFENTDAEHPARGRASLYAVDSVSGKDIKCTWSSDNMEVVKFYREFTNDSAAYFQMPKVGTATITATSVDKPSVSAQITIKVGPKGYPEIKKASNTKAGTISVKWQKLKGADGYTIFYTTDKNYKKNVKTKDIKNGKKTMADIKKLKKGKSYYIWVMAYKKCSDGKHYGKRAYAYQKSGDIAKIKIKK